MSLRILLPTFLIIFSLLVTLVGYLTIRSDLIESVEQESLRYMHIELSKYQSLLVPMLSDNDIKAINSLHSSKATELDNKAMLIVDQKGMIIASSSRQDLQNPWQATVLDVDAAIAEKTMKLKVSHTLFSEKRDLLSGYIDLCVKDLSKGLRGSSCGFLFYQIDMDYMQKKFRSWLIKQSIYIATGSFLSALLMMFVLNILVTKRVLTIQSALNLWSKGNRDTKIDLTGNDELNHIANIINSLVTRFAKDEEDLIFSQQVNNAILHSAKYSIISTDTHGIITTFNSSAEKLLGYDRVDLINKRSAIIFHDMEEIIAYNDYLQKELGIDIPISFETLVIKARTIEHDENKWTYIHSSGRRIPVKLSITALYDAHGTINGFLGIAHDISEELAAEEELEQLAYFDSLTKLPNRMLYNDRLNRAISFAKRHNTNVSIFFIDLNKFKFVNDNYGHEVGDKLLVRVAEILTQCVRESDTVARLGGDEFTIILPCAHTSYNKTGICSIAEKIINELSKDIFIDGLTLQVGASIGIAVYPDHGTDASTLNKHADIAMYQSKAKGRGCYVFYDFKNASTLDE